MIAPREILGQTWTHLVQAAVLLYMLVPVGSEPTSHSLDQDLHDIEAPREL